MLDIQRLRADEMSETWVETRRRFCDLADLERLVRAKPAIRFVGCEFTFPVELDLWAKARTTSFESCDFRSHVEGSGVHFSGELAFFGCIFRESISLAEATCSRGLTLAGCRVRMRQAPSKTDEVSPWAEYHEAPFRIRTAWWPGLRVTGLLRIDRTVFGGSLNMADARLDGPALMRGVRVGVQFRRNSRKQRGRLFLRQIQINGDVDLSPHLPASRKPEEAVESHVFGGVVLAGARIEGRLDVRGARIVGRLHMPHAHVRDRVRAELWHHSNDLARRHVLRTRIGERRGISVRLADAVIGHSVWLDGAHLDGQLDAKNVRVGGDFHFRALLDRGRHIPIRNLPAIVSLPPDQQRITESVRLFGARIDGSLDFTGTEATGTVNVENVHVGGDLHMRGLLVRAHPSSATGTGDIRLRMAHVERILDLRGADVAHDVDAYGATVKGDMLCGCWKRYFEVSGEAGGQQRQAANYRGRLILANAQVTGELVLGEGFYGGDVDAQGIKVGHHGNLTEAFFVGTVSFADASFEGSLLVGADEAATYFAKGLSLLRSSVRGDVQCRQLLLGLSLTGELRDAYFPSRDVGAARMDWAGIVAKNEPVEGSEEIVLNLCLAKIGGSWKHGVVPDGADFQSSPSLIVSGVVAGADLEVRGSMDFGYARVWGGLRFDSLRVGGDFSFMESVIFGDADFTGMKVEGGAFIAREENDQVTVPCPMISGDLRLTRAQIRELNIRLLRASEKGSRKFSPVRVSLEHARVGKLSVRGEDCPFEADPYFSLEGLEFQELDVADMCAEPTPLGTKDHFGGPGRFRRRLYCLAFPTAFQLGFLVVTTLWFPLLLERLVGAPAAGLVALLGILVYVRGWQRHRRRQRKYSFYPYPERECLFLAQAVEFDAGVHYRTEAWLRNQGMTERANSVYLERRLLELESGFLAWLLHYTRAMLLRRVLAERASGQNTWAYRWRSSALAFLGLPLAAEGQEADYYRELFFAGPEGRPAFQHPRCIWEKIEAHEVSKDEEFETELLRRAKLEWKERLSRTPRRMTEFVFYMAVGDGGRVGPALLAWLTTLLLLTFCVFDSPESVERPATFVAIRANPPEPASVRPRGKPEWVEAMGDAESEHWGPVDGFWIALNAQMPLASFTAREKWTPSGEPVHSLVQLSNGLRRMPLIGGVVAFFCDDLFDIRIPRCDTVAGLAEIWGWLTVPVTLAAITGLLKRRPVEIEKEGE